MLGTLDNPSDWPAEFVELQHIDSLLRCSICLEFLNITMIIQSCSHNYCSFCIRKHIIRTQSCPTCYKPLIDADLKCNRVMDEIVKKFKSMRTKLIEILKKYIEYVSNGEMLCLEEERQKSIMRNQDDDSEESLFETLPAFRNPMNTTLNKTSKGVTNGGFSVRNSNDTTLKKTPSKEESKGTCGDVTTAETVTCPVCNNKVAMNDINSHLDNCLKAKPGSSRSCISSQFISQSQNTILKRKREELNSSHLSRCQGVSDRSTINSKTGNDMILSSADPVMKRLPKVCLPLLSEKQLHNKAKLYGLSSHGDKKQLIKRIEQFILLYNTQCDSSNPMSPASIAKQVEESEKALLKHGKIGSILIHTHDLRYSVKEKEEFNRRYLQEHENHYQELINDIRGRRTLANNNKVTKVTVDELVEHAADDIKIEVIDDSPDALNDYSEILDHTAFSEGSIHFRKLHDYPQVERAEKVPIADDLGVSSKNPDILKKVDEVSGTSVGPEISEKLTRTSSDSANPGSDVNSNSMVIIQDALRNAFSRGIKKHKMLNADPRRHNVEIAEISNTFDMETVITSEKSNVKCNSTDKFSTKLSKVSPKSVDVSKTVRRNSNQLLTASNVTDSEKPAKLNGISRKKRPIQSRDIGSFFRTKNLCKSKVTNYYSNNKKYNNNDSDDNKITNNDDNNNSNNGNDKDVKESNPAVNTEKHRSSEFNLKGNQIRLTNSNSPIILSDDFDDTSRNSFLSNRSPSPSLLSMSEQPGTFDFNPLHGNENPFHGNEVERENISFFTTSLQLRSKGENSARNKLPLVNCCKPMDPLTQHMTPKKRFCQDTGMIDHVSVTDSESSFFDLSGEISNLVERAIENPSICSSISSNGEELQNVVISDTDDSYDGDRSASLIPRPPSNFDFSCT